MKIGVRTHHGEEQYLLRTQQMGAQGASLWASAFEGFRQDYLPRLDELAAMRERFERYDLEWTGLGLFCEGFMKNQLQGLPGRDEEIDKFCEIVRRIGEVYKDKAPSETPVMIIDQRPTYWVRGGWTGAARVPARGGVLFYDFDNDRDAAQRDMPMGRVTLEQTWERIAYLYKRLVPAAEEAGVLLATHPDDPPMPEYRGAAQALNSIAGFVKLSEMFPSPNNGMLLCLGCMAEAGEDAVESIRVLGGMGKVFYVHFRNVIGQVPHYTEVFPNLGKTDMRAALRALHEVGFQGYVVSDHQFGIAGDDQWASMSHAWQIGYITALLQTTP